MLQGGESIEASAKKDIPTVHHITKGLSDVEGRRLICDNEQLKGWNAHFTMIPKLHNIR